MSSRRSSSSGGSNGGSRTGSKAAGSSTASRQPVLFLSHGSPGLSLPGDFLDKSGEHAKFYKSFGQALGTPKGILCVSAHWEEKDGFHVNGAHQGAHSTIHDFYGFPKQLYEARYNAPTCPDLAQRVISAAESAGIKVQTKERGLDHGCWSPISLMYPKVDVPIVQLSLHVERGSFFNPTKHIQLGHALTPLRDEGYLIIASGGATHNLGNIFGDGKNYQKFSAWLDETLGQTGNQRDKQLADWESAPHASECHPRSEHFAPMFVAVGAAGADASVRKAFDLWVGTFSLAQYRFD